MVSYFISLLWGICILLSFVGWGRIINRILFPKDRVEWGQQAAYGIAFTIFVGGILNATYSISRAVILIYLGLGLLYWVISFFKSGKLSIKSFSYGRCHPKDWLFITGIIILILFVIVQYAGSVHTYKFNAHDDYQGYFVFPHKMLQMHSMGPDPFSGRRLLSSLGGQSFLHAVVLSIGSDENLHIIDPGISIIAALALLLGYFRNKRVSKRTTVLLLLLFLLVSSVTANISSVVASTVLVLGLFRFLDWKKLEVTSRLSNACIIALLAAGLCSLKSTNIPFCVIFIFSSYLFHIANSRGNRKAVIGELVMCALLVFAFILPWMISMYQSSGTLLYPMLGKGYHGSVYGSYSSAWDGVNVVQTVLYSAATSYLGVFFILFVIGVKALCKDVSHRRAVLSLMISAGLATLLLALAAGGYGVHRYSFCFFHATVIILIPIAYNAGADRKKLIQMGTSLAVIMVVAGAVVGQTVKYSYKEHLRFLDNIKAGINNTALTSDAERRRYNAMQQVLPESETVLTRLEKPFLLNFKRNMILIVDYPGSASLPPGMPFFRGAEAMADYLVSKSIRYVAYSYKNEAKFSKKAYGHRLRPDVKPIVRTDAQHTFDFQDNLKQLGKTRKKIYDDGEMFILDLLYCQI